MSRETRARVMRKFVRESSHFEAIGVFWRYVKDVVREHRDDAGAVAWDAVRAEVEEALSKPDVLSGAPFTRVADSARLSDALVLRAYRVVSRKAREQGVQADLWEADETKLIEIAGLLEAEDPSLGEGL